MQYKHETPHQSKILNPKRGVWYVFSGALGPWNPKPIPKFKTLNVECGMCLKVHCNHETPNQSLNCGTLGKRRRLWVVVVVVVVVLVVVVVVVVAVVVCCCCCCCVHLNNPRRKKKCKWPRSHVDETLHLLLHV